MQIDKINLNTIYLPNKYTNCYYNIIQNAKNRITPFTNVTEIHHIIPESFFINRKRKGERGWLDGDPNHLDNLIKLTPKEHFICHLLLTKMTIGEAKKKSAFAAWRMCNSTNGKITSRIYNYVRHLNQIFQKHRIITGETREKMSLAKIGKAPSNKGKPHSAETKEKIREKRKKQIIPKGRRHSEETKQKIREKRKLQKMAPLKEETKLKISASHRGMKVSEAAKMKIRLHNLGKKASEETKEKMRQARTGLLWWTNGKCNKKSQDCPGNGWYRGITKS